MTSIDDKLDPKRGNRLRPTEIIERRGPYICVKIGGIEGEVLVPKEMFRSAFRNSFKFVAKPKKTDSNIDAGNGGGDQDEGVAAAKQKGKSARACREASLHERTKSLRRRDLKQGSYKE